MNQMEKRFIDLMMSIPLKCWPLDLQELCKAEFKKVGFCGEVLHDCVVQWVLAMREK